MQTGVLIYPDDKSFQLPMSVKGMAAFAIQIIILHPFDERNRIPTHRPEFCEKFIERQAVQFSGLGEIEAVDINIFRRYGSSRQNILEQPLHRTFNADKMR